MINTKALLSKLLALLTASFVFCTTALAGIVYDNTTSSINNRSFAPPGNNVEFGDQVFLSGIDRRVTDFTFQYFLSDNASGNETAELFFRLNNGGASGTDPGTPVYRSGEFGLDRGFQTVTAQGLSVTVPNTFTWSVVFNGIDLGEQAGLLLYNPPTVGASFDDFWVKGSDGTTWQTFLVDVGATPANFYARVVAVPEPSTLALAILGGLACIGFSRCRRASQ